MDLPLSRSIVDQLEVLPEVGSTNAELVVRASGAGSHAAALPDFSVLVTDSQTDGKGRLGRVWVAPPGKTLAVSVLLRPAGIAPSEFGWLPLLGGLAMTQAVAELISRGEVGLKWPNDVQVDGLKIAGLLAELVPGLVPAVRGAVSSDAVVLGAGLNLTMAETDLPTPLATSLLLQGISADNVMDLALSAYLRRLRALYERFVSFEGDPHASGVRVAVTEACATIGRSVRVELPGAPDLFGVAIDIDAAGRLVVQSSGGGAPQHVAAGDVTHLRYE